MHYSLNRQGFDFRNGYKSFHQSSTSLRPKLITRSVVKAGKTPLPANIFLRRAAGNVIVPLAINEATLEILPTDQDGFNLVIGHYLAVHISIEPSAELLRMSSSELQVRLMRPGIPLRMGPESQKELDNEMKVIKKSLWRK